MRMTPQEFAQRFPNHPEAKQLRQAGGQKINAKKTLPKAPSWLEAKFEMDLKALRLPAPKAEHAFHPHRRWRFDFAWIDVKLAVEIEGGVLSRGRHVRPKGFQGDCEKYNAAASMGWTVLRFTGADVKCGLASATVERTLSAFYAQHQRLPSSTGQGGDLEAEEPITQERPRRNGMLVRG